MKLFSRSYFGENLRIVRSALRSGGLRAVTYLVRGKLQQILEPDRPSGLPLILHVETTSRCNLRCPSCAHSELLGKGDDMTLEQYRRFLDQFPYVGKVILYGIGEPTLHRDIFEMVRYTKRRGIYCGFFTNGTLLTERNREEILSSGQDYLNLSIDGATKESFERQRAGANFEKVCANIRALMAEIRARKHRIQVSVWNCLTAENLHELSDLVRLTADLGVKSLVVQDIMFWNSQGIEDAFSKKTIDLERTRRDECFRSAANEAKRLGITLDVMMSAGDGKRRCQLPWYFSYVTAKGLATPCNWHGWDGRLNFGNVLEGRFHEIWTSEAYADFRRKMKEAEVPEFCRGCPMYDRQMLRRA